MSHSKEQSQTAQIEQSILQTWAKERTFEASLEQRRDGPAFTFYDGPPFANGLPHFGHSLVTSIKDSIGRYKSMRGYYVRRRNGWDCHGLPVEFEIEKQLGVTGKRQIYDLGLDTFNAACRNSVFKYKHQWEDLFHRIGRWTETDKAYATLDRDFTESVWWTLKQVHQKGLLYKGFKCMPYCPRCETPLSNFELNEGYQDNVSDPSVFVKFNLVEEEAQIVAWTTTPWSLPGNAALAVNPNERYVYVALDSEPAGAPPLIIGKSRLKAVLKDRSSFRIINEVQGTQLVGKRYHPLFALEQAYQHPASEELYKIRAADFVRVDDGTAILHVAPAFGEEDLRLGKELGIPVLSTLNSSGRMNNGLGLDTVTGLFFKEADPLIIAHLTQRGMIYSSGTLQHTYPNCYRCSSPLFYNAIDTWFIRVSAIRDQMQKTAEKINWTPSHIKEGRFGKWIADARDWAISRNRYWGAPMPIWENVDDPNDYIVVGSIEELKALAGPSIHVDDLHRPFIDLITIERDGKTYKRIEEVADCWLESGSMPFAQLHYPFEHMKDFEANFPADFISEGLDQTRLWFYVQHVISTILFNKPAYKNVLVNGMILAADGRKLSKRLRNYPPLEDVFANEGADALRLYLLSNNQALSGEYLRFNRDNLTDIVRNVIGTLLNSYRFFKMYADIDDWALPTNQPQPTAVKPLDRWLVARVHETIGEVTRQADAYKIAHAITPIFNLIDDTSNWYIRRSRRRFWKAEDGRDKEDAYAVLHFALSRICELLAPWAPFVSDYVYRQLNDSSVHLAEWPTQQDVDAQLLHEMKLVRSYIGEALRQRAAHGIKVRQPLLSLTVPSVPSDYIEMIVDETNVKKVIFGKDVHLDTTITDDLRAEGLIRDLIRHVQNLRKTAGLQLEDRINLHLSSDSAKLQDIVTQFKGALFQETLAVELTSNQLEHFARIKLGEVEATLSLEKALGA